MKTDQYLEHHGVKGQKWGVKNGPPYPINNARNRAIKRVRKTAKTKKDVDRVVSTLNQKQRNFLGLNPEDKEYLTIEQGEYVTKRFLAKYGNETIGFFDILDETPNAKKGNLNLATAIDSNYQGKGYGAKLAKKGTDWVKKNRDKFDTVTWAAKQDNAASRYLAEKNGWKYNKKKSNKEWAVYNI